MCFSLGFSFSHSSLLILRSSKGIPACFMMSLHSSARPRVFEVRQNQLVAVRHPAGVARSFLL